MPQRRRSIQILVGLVLSLTFTISLSKLAICFWQSYETLKNEDKGGREVDQWLDTIQLGQHKDLFRRHGEYSQIISRFALSILLFVCFACLRCRLFQRLLIEYQQQPFARIMVLSLVVPGHAMDFYYYITFYAMNESECFGTASLPFAKTKTKP